MAENSKSIFRQVSLDRISRPDQTDDYLRLPELNIWLIIISAILFAAGATVWLLFS